MAFVIGEVVAPISGDPSGFHKAVSDVERAGNNLARNMSTKMQDVGKSMSNVGMGMSKYVTAPLVGVGTAAVMTVANFDDAMSKVRAISGATGDDFDKLRQQAVDLGSTTRFSAAEAAEGMSYLALAGWDTNEILEATPALLDLASAGAVELGAAADIVSDTMSAFGMSAEEATRASDVFARAQADSNQDVMMLGETMKYAAPVAQAFGASLEETAAIAGKMADAGIKGSQAGTALRSGFLRLAAPTKEVNDGLKMLGVEATNTDGSMRNVMDILRDMESGMGDLSESQRLQAMRAIFGTNAMAGWQAVMEQGVDSLDDLHTELLNADGSAKEISDTMEDNLAGAFRAMRSAIDGFLIQVGDVLKPYVQAAAEWIGNLAAKFGQLSDGAKRAIVIGAVIVAALGPILLIVGKVISIIGKLIPVFGQLGKAASFVARLPMMFGKIPLIIGKVVAAFAKVKAVFLALTGPIGIIIGIIALLVAGFVKLWRENEEFRESVIAAWEKIKASAIEIWNAIQPIIEGVMEGIKATVSVVLGWIAWFWETWGKTILDVVMVIWDQIALVIMTVVKVIAGIIDFVMSVIRGDWESAWEAIKSIGEAVWEFIKGTVENVFGAIATIIISITEAIGEFFEEHWEGIRDFFAGIWDAMKEKVNQVIEAMYTYVTDRIEAMKEWLAETWESIKETVSEAWENMKSAIAEKAQEIYDGIKERFTAVLEWIGGLPAQLLALGTEMISKLWDGIKNFFRDTVVGGIKDLIKNNIRNPFADIDLFQIGKDIVQGLINGIRNMGSNLTGAIRGVAEGAVDRAKAFFGIGSPSKVFEGIGTNIGEGLTIGIENAQRMVEGAMEGMSGRVISAGVISAGVDVSDDGAFAGMRGLLGGAMENMSAGIANAGLSGAGKQTVNHSGTIRIVGVGSKGEFVDSVDVVIERLAQTFADNDRRLQNRVGLVPNN